MNADRIELLRSFQFAAEQLLNQVTLDRQRFSFVDEFLVCVVPTGGISQHVERLVGDRVVFRRRSAKIQASRLWSRTVMARNTVLVENWLHVAPIIDGQVFRLLGIAVVWSSPTIGGDVPSRHHSRGGRNDVGRS